MAKRLDINGFIEQAKKVHGDKYDYSKVEYINNHTNVTIGCPVHGYINITPQNHLRGCGCGNGWVGRNQIYGKVVEIL